MNPFNSPAIRWLDPPPVEVPASFDPLGLHPLAARVLVHRGLTTLDTARAFLEPGHPSSELLPGMEQAVEVLRASIRDGEKICVWGDFDVDGQTSTALLVETLRCLGAEVTYHIPVRARESHGVHIHTLRPIIEAGTKLLLTCDTGITAHEAIDHARLAGLKVVVTDHHDLGPSLPRANAIVNPKQLPPEHPLATLAGVGVAYHLAQALLEGCAFEKPQLEDLAALGLVADVALLQGETRSLVQRGIQALRSTRRPGLRLIAANAHTELETLTEETIGFTFGPRLNALGRLDDANPAVDLLLSQDMESLRVIAARIEGLNAQRRLLTNNVFESAEAQIRQDPSLLAEPALILCHPDWPGGVIGIAASRLVERYNKPALLLSGPPDGMLRGSARSVEGLHITRAIASQSALLHGYGGHPMAAGLSLDAKNLPAFRKGLARAVEEQVGETAYEEPALQIDAWLGLDEMTEEVAEAFERLAPFGAGNPPVIFATRGVTLKSVSPVGKWDEHLRLNFTDEAGKARDVMIWNADEGDAPEAGSMGDVAFTMRATVFRGKRQVTAKLVDFRLVESPRPAELTAPAVECIDLRAEPRPEARLLELKESHPGILIWAEGTERAFGLRRYELHPAEELVIYTSPPSPAVLRHALETVSPKTAYFFCIPAAEDKSTGFLRQLSGLCKYAIAQRGGHATLAELAAAASQREMTVLHGLEWLRAAGHIEFEGEDELTLAPGTGGTRPALQAEFSRSLAILLDETAAYRKLYATAADPMSLLPH